MFIRGLLSLSMVAALSGSAFADPVVRPGGKPGAAASWAHAGKTVTLVIDADYDAEDVAQAIVEGVPGAQAKAAGDRVVITGVSDATLMAALEKIDVAPLGDDVDAMLGAVQNPGGDDDGSGSSIRATKAVTFDEVQGPPGHLIVGEVTKVRRARFPLVFITVEVSEGGTGGKALEPGTKILVLPRVKSKKGVVDPTDKASQLNVGAWYAQPGDRVKVRLEAKPRKKIWVAKAFERVK